MASVTAVRGLFIISSSLLDIRSKKRLLYLGMQMICESRSPPAFWHLLLLRAITLDIKSIKQVLPELLYFLLSYLTVRVLTVTRKN